MLQLFAAGAACFGFSLFDSHAQGYPAKPMRLMAGFAPGGATGAWVRAMDITGTTLDFWARVKARIALDAYGLVELDLGTRNLEGRESTPGAALVALPFRNGKAVPYRFVPPSVDPWAREE